MDLSTLVYESAICYNIHIEDFANLVFDNCYTITYFGTSFKCISLQGS